MNSSHSVDPRDSAERASLWAARLDGSKLSPDDQVSLDRWLDEHPDHRRQLAEYCQFSADLERLLPELAASGGVDEPSETLPRRRRSRTHWAAAACAAAAAVVMTLWLRQPSTQWENIATPSAQRQTLTLVDGSQINLNAQTTLEVVITPDERRLRLATGEAFFEVQKDPSRPFIVETPAGAVQVTGTRFALRSESPRRMEVLVQEGSVDVRPEEAVAGRPAAQLMLTAGDRLIAADGGTSTESLSPQAVADALAWREGWIVFARTPLSEAIERFGRYHGRGITTTDQASILVLGGRYRLDDLEGFLSSLEAALPVRVSRSLSGTTRISLRTEP